MSFRPLSVALFLAAAEPTAACDIALILTIDVSSSVDAGEFSLQIDGLAAALRMPKIQEALIRAEANLMVIQWSGVNKQRVMLDWTKMRDPASVTLFADRAEALPRAFADSDTAPADAIDFAMAQFASAPRCARQVIDVSGDGAENAGGDTRAASARAYAAGVQINGIAIESLGVAISGFYRRAVATPDGFVLTARLHQDYPRAIAEKLLREVTKVAS